MSSQPMKVTLVGASGRLGPYILSALQAEPSLFDVTVITRKSSSATFPGNTKVVKVSDDYPDDEMVSVFQGQDAVILSLGFAADYRHIPLIEASIKAGVKRIIPSYYGANVSSKEMQQVFPVAKMKADLLEYLETKNNIEGWSWSAICCGLLFDYCIGHNFFTINHENYTARILDDGSAKFSASEQEDVGKAVANVLKHLDATKNRIVYVSSYETSFNEMLAAYKEATGVDEWKVEYVSSEEEITLGHTEMQNGNFKGMGRIGKATMVRPGFGMSLESLGVLDNKLLGIDKSDAKDTIKRLVREGKITQPPAI